MEVGDIYVEGYSSHGNIIIQRSILVIHLFFILVVFGLLNGSWAVLKWWVNVMVGLQLSVLEGANSYCIALFICLDMNRNASL